MGGGGRMSKSSVNRDRWVEVGAVLTLPISATFTYIYKTYISDFV
jgi:hypothetical protein